jgi:hypothetical protein
MKKNWLARIALIASLGALPLALALPASAANGPAQGTGLTGACNMLAGVGMGHAMTVNAKQGTNGNDGMWRAVDVSGCS